MKDPSLFIECCMDPDCCDGYMREFDFDCRCGYQKDLDPLENEIKYFDGSSLNADDGTGWTEVNMNYQKSEPLHVPCPKCGKTSIFDFNLDQYPEFIGFVV